MNRRALICFSTMLIGVASSVPGTRTLADQAGGQIQAQTRPTLAVAPATIRGIVRSTDGKPLRRVQITLAPANPTSPSNYAGIPPPAPTSTNSRGEFQLKNVPPGSYRLTAIRSGYLTLQYGQRRPQEAGRTLEVNDGQLLERVDLNLPRAGVITGTVTDENGEPYSGVRIQAVETRYVNGRLVRFPAAGGDNTDDRGHFRVTGLMPGTYYLQAYSGETFRSSNAQRDVYTYGWLFFPGVSADRAEPITLGVSEVRAGIDFRLVPTRGARVSGRVLLSNGTPASGMTIMPLYDWRDAGLVSGVNANLRTTTDRDGVFEIRDLPPGEYRLSTGGNQETGDANVSVNGADMGNVLITMHSNVGSNVNGIVMTDEGTAPPFAASGVRVTLEPGGPVLSSIRVFNVNPDWTFRMMSIGGSMVFRFTGLRDDWMLKSIKWNDEDVTDRVIEIPAGGQQLDGVQMVITRKIGKLSGDVLDKASKPTPDATIVVFADDPKLWGPATRFIRTTRPDDNGHFTITGLPPGLYRAVARDFIVNGQWLNPDYLEGLKRDAVRFQLLEGGSQIVTLKLP